jgi:hypothetical protein
MVKRFISAAALLVSVAGSALCQPVTLSNSSARAAFDLAGGGFTSFELTAAKLNPFTWDSKRGDGARPRGHFLCFDRWGAPSLSEAANGMPFHGEAPFVNWKLDRSSASEAAMAASLPIAQLSIRRTVRLHASEAVLSVTETVRNDGKLGRVYNLVQHPTIAPPFLAADTVVDSNARKGFMQSTPMPNPEEPPVWWPQALKEGQPVDLRRLTNDPLPNVVSYTLDEEYGWVTAATPSQGLLLGYIWRTREYPWLNIWRHVENGKPAARGLEFGTTGLHQPPPILVAKGKIFGRPIFDFLDAGSEAQRSYAAFLVKISAGFQGVDRLSYRTGRITLHERGSARVIELNAGSVLPE